MNIYYDRFAFKYVTEIGFYAAPERYYKILCNEKEDMCIEQWLMSNGDVVDIEYKPLTGNSSKEEIDHVYALREKEEITHKSRLSYMLTYTIPKANYIKIEKWVMDDEM